MTIGVLFIFSVILIVTIGWKIYMDNKEFEKIHVERKAALEIKSRFKDIKEIIITDLYESSLRIKNIDYDVVELGGNIIKGNSITVGDFGSFSDNGLTSGVTKGKIKVIYTTKSEKIIE